MTNEVTSIGVGMETDAIERGIKSLQTLAGQGPAVEKSMAGVEQAAGKTTKVLRTLGDGASKGLDEVSKAAPKAEQGINRLFKSADEARAAISAMATQSRQAGNSVVALTTGVKGSQAAFADLQAQVRAMTQNMTQMAAGLGRVLPTMQAVAQAQEAAARSAANFGSVLASTSRHVQDFNTKAGNSSEGVKKLGSGADGAAEALGRMNAVLALAGAGVSVKSIIDWTDGYTKFTAQLRNTSDGATAYAAALDSVKRISTDSQTGIGELGVLYARIATSTKELGISQKQVAQITETVAMSLKANGASASEASSAMLQLSQAFGSGVLRGEEFNAVYEAAPNLLRNLADAMGVPQGKLREMASDGKLTADVLAKYLPQSLDKVRKEAESMATIGGSFTVLNNKIMEFVGSGSQASGVAKAISSSVVGLANNLETVASVAGAVSLVIAGRYVGSLKIAQAETIKTTAAAVTHQIALARTAAAIGGYSVASTARLVAMTAAARTASLAMGALGGPVGLAVTAIGLGAAAFYAFGESAKTAAADIGGLKQPIDELLTRLSALPPEKRVGVILDFNQQQQQSVVDADAAVEKLIQSVGDLTNMRLPADEWHALRDRVEGAAKSGKDLTPILQAAASSAGVPAAQLNQWLQLAGNLRTAQMEASELKRKLDDLTGRSSAGGGRGGSYHPLSLGVGENAREFDLRTGAALNAQVKAALEASKGYKSLSERMAEVRKEGDSVRATLKELEKAGRGTSKEADQLRSRLQGVDEKLQSMAKSGQTGASSLKQQESAYKSLMSSVNERIAALELEASQVGKLTEGQKAQIKLTELLKDGKKGIAAAAAAQAQAQINVLIGLEKEQKAIKSAIDLNDERVAQQEEIAKAMAEMQNRVSAANVGIYEYGKGLKNAAEMHDLELSAMGKSAEAREILLEQLRIEQERRERIDALASVPYENEAARLAAEAQINAQAAQAMANAANKVMLDSWKTSVGKYDDIFRQGFADMLNDGKDGWDSFTKSLATTFKTTVADQLYKAFAQPFVVNVVGNLLGVTSSLTGGGATGGANNAMSALNGLNSLSTMYSAFTGGVTSSLATGIGTLGKTFGSNALTSFANGMSGKTIAANMVGPSVSVPNAASGAGSMFGSAMSYVGYVLAIAQGMRMSGQAFDEGYRWTDSQSLANSAIGAAPVTMGFDTKMTQMFGFSERTANMITSAALWAKGLEMVGLGAATPHTGAGAIYQAGALQEGSGIYNQASFGMGIADEYAATAQASVSSIAAQAGNTLDAVAKLFNQQAGYSVATAFADDRSKDGAWGSLKIADAVGNALIDWEQSRASKWAPKEFSDGEAGYNEYLSAVQADVLKAIQGMNLPTWAKDMFAAAEGAEGLQVALQSVAVTFATLEQLGKNMPMFAGMSDDMTSSLLKAYDGIDALSASAGVFYEKLYSQEERMEAAMNQIAEIVGIDPRLGEEAKAAFKKATEDAIAGGQAGIAGGLMNMSAAFAEAADYAAQAAKDAAKSAEDAAKAAQDAAQEAHESAVDGAWRNLEAAVGREKEYWQEIASASQSAVSSLSSTLNLLTSNARDLYGTVDSTAQWQAAQGMVYIENALAAVRGGADMTGFQGLQDAISAARGGISGGVYASSAERDYDALVLAGQLQALGELTDDQLSIEERALRAANEQISQLDKTLQYWQEQIDGTTGVIDATLSVSQAIAVLTSILTPKTVATAAAAAVGGGGGGYVYGTGNTVLDAVADYGNAHGSDAYYLIPGLNDYAAKLASVERIAELTGMTVEQSWANQAAQTGKGQEYWQAVQQAVDGGAVVRESDSLEEILRKAGVPGYASGGFHAGGLRIVGERGPELEYTGPSRIFNHMQTAAMLGGSSGNTDRLERLVEGLTKEVQRLQALVDTGNGHAAQSANVLTKVTMDGNGMITQPAPI